MIKVCVICEDVFVFYMEFIFGKWEVNVIVLMMI